DLVTSEQHTQWWRDGNRTYCQCTASRLGQARWSTTTCAYYSAGSVHTGHRRSRSIRAESTQEALNRSIPAWGREAGIERYIVAVRGKRPTNHFCGASTKVTRACPLQ